MATSLLQWLFLASACSSCVLGQMSMGGMDMGGGSSSSSASSMALYSGPSYCCENPGNEMCQNATAAIADICMTDPSLASCSIFNQCLSGIYATDTNVNTMTCDPFNLLATLCRLDPSLNMSALPGCHAYTDLCTPPAQLLTVCSAAPGLAYLPTTATLTAMMESLCTDPDTNTSTACVLCSDPGACDLLGNYSDLCLTSNSSSLMQCVPWSSMCTANPTLYLCASAASSSSSAMYGMTFIPDWNALNFSLMFSSWVPQTSNQLCGAFFAIFFLALAHCFLMVLMARLERHWQLESKDLESTGGEVLKAGSGGWFPWHERCLFLPWSYSEVSRMLLQFITSSLTYLLMIAVMSGSAVIFFAVVTGIAVGTLLFHRFRTQPLPVAWASLQPSTAPSALAQVASQQASTAAVWLLRAVELSAAILVLVLVLRDNGGVPSFGRILDTSEWNYHVLLMFFAFPIAMSEALLAYKEPLLGMCRCTTSCQCNQGFLKCACGNTCGCHRQFTWQLVHMVLQTAAVVMAFIGLAAIVFYKENPQPDVYAVEFVQVYTVHAFLGTLTLFLMACQYLIGLVGFVALTLRPQLLSPAARSSLASGHAFLGKLSFLGGVVSCLVGFMDMQVMSVDTWAALNAAPDVSMDSPSPPGAPPAPEGAAEGFGPRSSGSLEASFLGTLLLGVTVAHLFLDTATAAAASSASRSAPQQSVLITIAGRSCKEDKEAEEDVKVEEQADAEAGAGAAQDSVDKGQPSRKPSGSCCCSTKAAVPAAPHAAAASPAPVSVEQAAAAAAAPASWLASHPLVRVAAAADWTLLLVRSFEITAAILIFVLIIRDNGGLPDWSDASNASTWNWHALLMTLAFPVLMSEAVLAYKGPLVGGCKCGQCCGSCERCPYSSSGVCRCTRRSTRKAVHVLLQTGAIVMMFLGLAAITFYKRSGSGGGSVVSVYSQVYSLHAFIGAITLGAAACQFLFGLCSGLLFRHWISEGTRSTVTGWHAFFGKATFCSGLISCIAGLMDMQMISVDNGYFEQRSPASMECSFLGVVIFGLAAAHWYLDTVKALQP